MSPRSVLLVASLLALGIVGCGSSGQPSSSADRISLHRIDGLLSALTQLQGQINADPFAGTRPGGHSEYVAAEAPLIARFGAASRELAQRVAALKDVEGVKLYTPLAEVNHRAAQDLRVFLNAVLARDRASATRASTQLSSDEQRINEVAIEQFPKVRAYALKLGTLS